MFFGHVFSIRLLQNNSVDIYTWRGTWKRTRTSHRGFNEVLSDSTGIFKGMVPLIHPLLSIFSCWIVRYFTISCIRLFYTGIFHNLHTRRISIGGNGLYKKAEV